jgi:hypothetical protein
MAYYLARARPRTAKLPELKERLRAQAFIGRQLFGRALTKGLRAARVEADGGAVRGEEDYCSPPLAEERAAVLDDYFDDIRVEAVRPEEGWRRIEDLPGLFPDLEGEPSPGDARF